MSDIGDIQNKLVEILTSDNEEDADLMNRHLDYVSTILQNNSDGKVVRIAIQVVEKCGIEDPLAERGLQILVDIMARTNDRKIKIAAAQSISLLSRNLSTNLANVLTMLKDLQKRHISDILINRHLNTSVESVQRTIEAEAKNREDQAKEKQVDDNEDNEETEEYNPEGVEEQNNSTEINQHDHDRGNYTEDNVHAEAVIEGEGDGEIDPEASSSGRNHLGFPVQGSVEEFVLALPDEVKECLRSLFGRLSEVRWREINGRLKSFYKANVTTPKLVEKHMRLNYEQVEQLMAAAGFACPPQECIPPSHFDRLLQVTQTIIVPDFYNTAKGLLGVSQIIVDNRFHKTPSPIATERTDQRISRFSAPLGSSAPNSGEGATRFTMGVVRQAADGTAVREHDEATPFLLIRNLPHDVLADELLRLLQKTTGCDYLEAKDIIIPRTTKQPAGAGAHAYVNFQHIRDARKSRNDLNGKIFGGRPLEIEYSLGRPNNSVWIGAVPPELSEDQINACMRKFGPVSRIDLKRGRGPKADSYAFAVYDHIDDAIRAVKGMSECDNKIDGIQVRIGYSSSKVDQQLLQPLPSQPSASDKPRLSALPSYHDGGYDRDRDYDESPRPAYAPPRPPASVAPSAVHYERDRPAAGFDRDRSDATFGRDRPAANYERDRPATSFDRDHHQPFDRGSRADNVDRERERYDEYSPAHREQPYYGAGAGRGRDPHYVDRDEVAVDGSALLRARKDPLVSRKFDAETEDGNRWPGSDGYDTYDDHGSRRPPMLRPVGGPTGGPLKRSFTNSGRPVEDEPSYVEPKRIYKDVHDRDREGDPNYDRDYDALHSQSRRQAPSQAISQHRDDDYNDYPDSRRGPGTVVGLKRSVPPFAERDAPTATSGFPSTGLRPRPGPSSGPHGYDRDQRDDYNLSRTHSTHDKLQGYSKQKQIQSFQDDDAYNYNQPQPVKRPRSDNENRMDDPAYIPAKSANYPSRYR